MHSRHAAVVACYGDRQPEALGRFVAEVQGLVAEALPDFAPRPVRQVHTTVIGLDSLEPIPDGPAREVLSRPGGPDVRALASYLLRELADAPVTVQLGGFGDRDHPLRSRGQRLFDRSIVVDRGQVVLVGWPVDADGPNARLDELRRSCAALGFAHRYPLADPDAHLVIGSLAGAPPEVLSRLRGALAGRCCRVELAPERLAAVVYDDSALPEHSTAVLPLSDLT